MEGDLKRLAVFLFLLSCAGLILGMAAAYADPGTLVRGTVYTDPGNVPDPSGDCMLRCMKTCEPGHWYTGLCLTFCAAGCNPLPPFILD